MKKSLNYFAAAFSLLLAMLFVGCTIKLGKPGPYMGDETALFTVATFNVPVICQIAIGIEAVEEDDQGRIMFRITGGNSPLYYRCFGQQNKMFALAICQHSDEKMVYYYEDDCYLLYANVQDLSTIDIEHLKERNDWNQPLQFEKMTTKEIIPKEEMGYKYTNLSVEYAIRIESYEAKEAFLKQIDLGEKYYAFPSILDDDGEGRILLIVETERIENRKTDTSTIRSYLEMYDTKEGRGEKTVIGEIKDPSHIWIQIKEFKQQNNWRMP